MDSEVAFVRRAQQLLQAGTLVDDVVDDMRSSFGLSVVDAIAVISEYVSLTNRGTPIGEEPFARPFV